MLLLSLTTHMSLDLAPIPFLWILPLTLYLLSFILCFDAEGWYRRVWFLAASPLAFGVLAWLTSLGPSDRPAIRLCIPLYSLSFFIICMVCHGELSRLKPHPKFLTGFFLMVSVGGAAGGVLVALFAPSVFNASYELPISIAFCGLLAAFVVFLDSAWPFRRDLLGWPSILVFTAAAALLGFLGRDVRDMVKNSLVVTRNFYGEMRVNQYNGLYAWDGYRSLVHGAINHGEEYTHPARRREVATYYCPDTGLGRVMSARNIADLQRVAIIGLGTGTVAGYSRMGDLYRFYEINPVVEKIARQDFWYLKNAEGAIDIVLGDARLSLEREPVQNYDTIAVDAFSSDSIPVHLLTREALQLYLDMLAPDGVLVLHISNRYLELEPVVANLAEDAALGGRLIGDDESEEVAGATRSTWVVLAPTAEALGGLVKDERWAAEGLEPDPRVGVWTDDFHNLLSVLKWR
jgi:SAM-dependent methyltransferase